MRLIRFLFHSVALSLCAVLLLFSDARAYVDPGTGSYILQIVLAGLVGTAFMLKLFWKRIQFFVSNNILRKTDRRKNDPPDEDG